MKPSWKKGVFSALSPVPYIIKNICTVEKARGENSPFLPLFMTFILACTGLLSPWAFCSAAPGDTVRCSVSSAGEGGNDESIHASVTSDGRYVVFASRADNLAAGDSNESMDVFLKDMSTGGIIRCSTSSSGAESNGDSRRPAISADGRYVVFESIADNLVSNDTNLKRDIFRKDINTGELVRCSTSSSGAEAARCSYRPAISGDGRYTAFESYASNLVMNDTNNEVDIFVKDLQTGAVVRCSTSAEGEQANERCQYPAMSFSGRYVAFSSWASNLVPDDDNEVSDVFRKDMMTGEITVCSANEAGTAGNERSFHPAISADGRYIAFASHASNLVLNDSNQVTDVFLKDMDTGALTMCSASPHKGQANGISQCPSISPEGAYVAFETVASNLAPDDTNRHEDIYVKEIDTGTLVRRSTSSSGEQGKTGSFQPCLSADGIYLVFYSGASEFVPDDLQGFFDVFRKELTAGGLRLSD